MTFYDDLARVPKSLASIDIPEYFPLVTPDDIMNGYLSRYFTRQTNYHKGEIIEINDRTARSLNDNTLFVVVTVEWRISGPLDDSPGMGQFEKLGVRSANRLALELAETAMPDIKYRLTNLIQYWIGK